MKKLIYKSILAGLLIGLASCIYMYCENKYIGAFLFSTGLIGVLVLESNLFTGKIGYVNSLKSSLDALLILCINLLTSYIVGIIYRYSIGVTTIDIGSRFLNYTWYSVLLKGFGTGILIYLAVELYKKTSSLIPVIICVMAFIIGGMYHCIADACYLGTTTLTWSKLLYLLLVIIGNSLGSLFTRFIQLKGEEIVK